ncbi:MAG: cytochrome C oxidase subunit IV family protein [Acidimicrobiales bacterium]
MATADKTIDQAHDKAHDHPSDGQYIKIAVILAIVTALEVGLYYKSLPGASNNVALLVLALLKFVVVVGYFMHLKFDNQILRRVFAFGFVLALLIYAAALFTFSWIG